MQWSLVSLLADESYLNPVVKAQVESLIEQSSTDVVVVASAAGDVSTIRSFLKSNPKEVINLQCILQRNIREYGSTYSV